MTASPANPSRISRRFAELRNSGEMGIVAYITAGDPSFAATRKFVIAMAEAGADVIELGVPFSDPLADGPTIQRASERALKNGATLAGVIDLVREIRKSDSPANQVPIVLFSYYNPVLQMGLEKFAAASSAAGADGVLITDFTPEESEDYRRILAAHHLDTVFLGAPTSTDERLAKIAACSSGFLYLISRTGITGAKDSLHDDLPALLRRARSVTQLPIAVGFGISLPGHVSVLGGLADAAVVGSALVSEIENATANNSLPAAIESAAHSLADRIRSLKSAAQTGLSRREVAR
jgi:tryptophan synthase alpha chain